MDRSDKNDKNVIRRGCILNFLQMPFLRWKSDEESGSFRSSGWNYLHKLKFVVSYRCILFVWRGRHIYCIMRFFLLFLSCYFWAVTFDRVPCDIRYHVGYHIGGGCWESHQSAAGGFRSAKVRSIDWRETDSSLSFFELFWKALLESREKWTLHHFSKRFEWRDGMVSHVGSVQIGQNSNLNRGTGWSPVLVTFELLRIWFWPAGRDGPRC